MTKIKEGKIADLIQDDRNLNKGTEEGRRLIEKSLRKFGAGRSVLIDKNNRIIAGNKTHENAEAIGMDDVIIVETDGRKLVAVKRTDIDLDSPEGREMALADNATVKVDLQWDDDQIKAVAADFGVDMEEWGVFEETDINPDEFFDSLSGSEGGNKGEKIVIEIPVSMLDKKEEIRTIVKDTLIPYENVKVI